MIRNSRTQGLPIFNTNVRLLFLEYLIDPNCRPELWVKACAFSEDERKQFLTLAEWHTDVWKKTP
jgi:hypothetical protein